MKYLNIKKCCINDGTPFFHLSASNIFPKSFKRNMVAKKFEQHLYGELDRVVHSGKEYFLSKSVFTSVYGTPVYLVNVNDDPAPIGFLYAVKTKYITEPDWRFEYSLLIEHDSNVENYGYTEVNDF